MPNQSENRMPATARQTVLIIEDDALLRDTYWVALLEAGHRGVATARADKILDVMYAENVSVVLLDLFTPGMDGVEMIRSIKRISPETLVIATGKESPGLDGLAVATELGADGFIRKPASAEAVLEAVTTLTSQSVNTSPTDRRKYTRLSVDQKGYLCEAPDGAKMACRIVDLSAGGALIETKSPCPQDRPLVLHVDGFGNFEGVVVRSSQGSVGFKFLMGELKRARLKHALASFAKTGTAPIDNYGVHPNFKPGSVRPRKERRDDPERRDIFPYT